MATPKRKRSSKGRRQGAVERVSARVRRAVPKIEREVERQLKSTSSRKGVLAGGSALGTGVLAIAGYLMRNQISGLVKDVVAEAMEIGKNFRLSDVLELAGLQRKRSSLWTILPTVTFGMAAGSALTLLLMPRSRYERVADVIGKAREAVSEGKSPLSSTEEEEEIPHAT